MLGSQSTHGFTFVANYGGSIHVYVCYVIMFYVCVRTWIVCQHVRIFMFVAALFHPKLKNCIHY